MDKYKPEIEPIKDKMRELQHIIDKKEDELRQLRYDWYILNKHRCELEWDGRRLYPPYVLYQRMEKDTAADLIDRFAMTKRKSEHRYWHLVLQNHIPLDDWRIEGHFIIEQSFYMKYHTEGFAGRIPLSEFKKKCGNEELNQLAKDAVDQYLYSHQPFKKYEIAEIWFEKPYTLRAKTHKPGDYLHKQPMKFNEFPIAGVLLARDIDLRLDFCAMEK